MQKSFLGVVAVFLMALLVGCAGGGYSVNTEPYVPPKPPRSDFFGVMITDIQDAYRFRIDSLNEENQGTFSRLPSMNASIYAFANRYSSWNEDRISISVTNESNNPIFTNYFSDQFGLLTKDGKKFVLEKPEIRSYHRKSYINPNETIEYVLYFPPVLRGISSKDIELIVCALGNSNEITIFLKPAPPLVETPKQNYVEQNGVNEQISLSVKALKDGWIQVKEDG